jgi:hypothetical protein
LDRRNIRSKRREGAGGRLAGGQKFSRGALYLMLQNRLYRGEIAHKDNVYPGQHDGIVDSELWQTVQDKLAVSRRERSMAVGAEAPSLLSGLIVDSDGNRMSPTHAVKKGKRYRYYVSAPLITGSRSEHLDGRRIPAGEIEGLVLDRLRSFFASGTEVSDALAPLGLDALKQRALLDRSAKLAECWTTFASLELRALVKSLVQKVESAMPRSRCASIELRSCRAYGPTQSLSRCLARPVLSRLSCRSSRVCDGPERELGS